MTPEQQTRDQRRAELRARMQKGMEDALKDTAELARHPGPYTWSIEFHDGLFFQFCDVHGRPCLGNDIREPEDAAWLLTMLNRPYQDVKD